MEWLIILFVKRCVKVLFAFFVLALLIMILRGNVRLIDDAKEFLIGWRENAAIIKDAIRKWLRK